MDYFQVVYTRTDVYHLERTFMMSFVTTDCVLGNKIWPLWRWNMGVCPYTCIYNTI